MATQDSDREFELAQQEFLAMANQIRALQGEAPLTEVPQPPFCNFCGRSKSEVRALVEGIDAHICDRCVGEASRLIRVE